MAARAAGEQTSEDTTKSIFNFTALARRVVSVVANGDSYRHCSFTASYSGHLEEGVIAATLYSYSSYGTCTPLTLCYNNKKTDVKDGFPQPLTQAHRCAGHAIIAPCIAMVQNMV